MAPGRLHDGRVELPVAGRPEALRAKGERVGVGKGGGAGALRGRAA